MSKTAYAFYMVLHYVKMISLKLSQNSNWISHISCAKYSNIKIE